LLGIVISESLIDVGLVNLVGIRAARAASIDSATTFDMKMRRGPRVPRRGANPVLLEGSIDHVAARVDDEGLEVRQMRRGASRREAMHPGRRGLQLEFGRGGKDVTWSAVQA